MKLFFQRLAGFARPYRTRLILGLVCGVFYSLIEGFLVVVIKILSNVIFPGSETASFAKELEKVPVLLKPLARKLLDSLPSLHNSDVGIIAIVCAVPAIMLVRNILSYLNIYLTTWSALRTVAGIRIRVFNHLQNLPLGFFSSARTGELISRVISDTQLLNGIIANTLPSLIKDPLSIIILSSVILSQQPRLTLISLVVLPVLLVPIIVYGKKVRKSAGKTQAHTAQLSSLMHESFTGNRIVKAYNLEDTVLGRFKVTIGNFVGQMMRVMRANEIPSQITEFLGAIGISLVCLYVVFVTNKSQNRMTAGDFTQFIAAIFLMYRPIKSLTRIHNQLEQARAASQSLFNLLEIRSDVTDPPNPVPLRAASADIEFDDVDFAYSSPDRAGEADKPKTVLHEINLTVKAGTMVALVGGSGAGKTTLANLLLRFYDPRSGAVRIGGVDLRQVSLKDLRAQIALVAQEMILFNDTIRNNIAMGRPGATDADIEAAARHAYAHEFILEKPQGYDTVVGEKGASLSGGQRQRIAIARAILRDAPILILDEATNALDAESERVVQAALEKLMKGRTTICIAHRLSTIQKADLIVVMDKGRIVETGAHAELARNGGIYSKLRDLQNPLAMA